MTHKNKFTTFFQAMLYSLFIFLVGNTAFACPNLDPTQHQCMVCQKIVHNETLKIAMYECDEHAKHWVCVECNATCKNPPNCIKCQAKRVESPSKQLIKPFCCNHWLLPKQYHDIVVKNPCFNLLDKRYDFWHLITRCPLCKACAWPSCETILSEDETEISAPISNAGEEPTRHRTQTFRRKRMVIDSDSEEEPTPDTPPRKVPRYDSSSDSNAVEEPTRHRTQTFRRKRMVIDSDSEEEPTLDMPPRKVARHDSSSDSDSDENGPTYHNTSVKNYEFRTPTFMECYSKTCRGEQETGPVRPFAPSGYCTLKNGDTKNRLLCLYCGATRVDSFERKVRNPNGADPVKGQYCPKCHENTCIKLQSSCARHKEYWYCSKCNVYGERAVKPH